MDRVKVELTNPQQAFEQPVQPVVNSLMQRTLDLHNRCSMPWSDAAKLSLSEVGIDDARVHELAGNCSDTPMATLLNPDEIQDFTRSLLIYGSDLLHAATRPAAQRTWVGLTVNERGKVYADWRWSDGRTSNLALCEAIEAKLKEKNNG